MSSRKSGSKKSEKQKASVVEQHEGELFSNGRLKIPSKQPAVDINTVIPEDQKIVIGGNNLVGTKSKKKTKKSPIANSNKENGKLKNSKKATHVLVKDIVPLLPKSWSVEETHGFYTIFNPQKKAVGHARNNLSGSYLSFRLFPETTVRKPVTVSDLKAIVTEMTTPKKAPKKAN